MQYICMKHDLYPSCATDKYKVNRIVDIVYSDCKFFDPLADAEEFFQLDSKEDKLGWCLERMSKKVPGYLKRLETNCKESI